VTFKENNKWLQGNDKNIFQFGNFKRMCVHVGLSHVGMHL